MYVTLLQKWVKLDQLRTVAQFISVYIYKKEKKQTCASGAVLAFGSASPCRRSAWTWCLKICELSRTFAKFGVTARFEVYSESVLSCLL